MSAEKPRFSPVLILGLGVTAVSAASLLVRFAQQAGAPSLVIAAWRLSLASLILLPLGLWRHGHELRVLPRSAWLTAGVAGLFLGVHFGAWITSLAYTSVASSIVLVSTAPLFVALISAAVLREPPRPVALAGMLVALGGGALVSLADACGAAGCPPLRDFISGEAFYGDLLALVGAVAVAVYLVLGRRLRRSMPLLVYILLTYGAAALVLDGAVLAAGLPVFGYPAEVYLWCLLLALLPQLIGHSAYAWALRYLPPTFVSVTVLGEPVGSIVLALMFLGEVPAPAKLLGGALILGGILIASRQAGAGQQ